MSAVDRFIPLLQEAEEDGVATPCFTSEGINVRL